MIGPNDYMSEEPDEKTPINPGRPCAGVDHPVYSNCPESRYLKVLWSRVV